MLQAGRLYSRAALYYRRIFSTYNSLAQATTKSPFYVSEKSEHAHHHHNYAWTINVGTQVDQIQAQGLQLDLKTALYEMNDKTRNHPQALLVLSSRSQNKGIADRLAELWIDKLR